jgi:3-oxoacyl-[acyl-carrier protein] reductase
MNLEFTGRRVLIAGGSCDLGLRLAKLLIGEGLHPIATWRSEEGRRKILKGLGASADQDGSPSFDLGSPMSDIRHPTSDLRPPSFESIKLDLDRPESIDTLFDKIGEDLDYLVDFAQGDFESLVGSADPDLIEGYFSGNVISRALLVRRAARAMLRKKRGRMVFVSSAAAARANPGQGFYAAAKLASEALYRSAGIELAGRGITTVSLRPGYIDAGRGARFMAGRDTADVFGRALSPGEVAGAILFLLSDGAAGFNATEIRMDGGLGATKP